MFVLYTQLYVAGSVRLQVVCIPSPLVPTLVAVANLWVVELFPELEEGDITFGLVTSWIRTSASQIRENTGLKPF